MKILIKTNTGTLKLTGILLTAFAVIALATVYTNIGFSAESASGTTELNFTVEQAISVTPSAEGITYGILFGTVNMSTTLNPATNNTDCTSNLNTTCYNFTASSGNTDDVAFYHKMATALTCTGGTCSANANATNTTTGLIAEWDNPINVTEVYTAIGNNADANCAVVDEGSFCNIQYWLNVSAGVTSGDYGTASNYGYCANATHGATAC